MKEITFRIQQWKSLPEFEITFHEEKKLSGALKEKQGSEMKRQEEMLVQAKRMYSAERK